MSRIFHTEFNTWEPKIRIRQRITWQRGLSEISKSSDDVIVNEDGVSINHIEKLCKKKDGSISDKVYGIPLHDAKELFVELTDRILFNDYEKHVKTEKDISSSTYQTLKYMQKKIHKKVNILVNETKTFINELFENYDLLHDKNIEELSNVKVCLDVNGDNEFLLINGRDVYFYIKDVKFTRNIPLNIESSLEKMNEIYVHNEKIFSEYVKKVFKLEEDIKTYLGTGGNRFPLNYTHWNNRYINITQNVAVRAFMDEFYNYFNNIEMKLKHGFSTIIEIDISYLDSMLVAINDIIKATIEQKTTRLFGILHKLFQGDLKGILGFFTFLFEKEDIKNANTLRNIEKKKSEDAYDNNFLFDVENLYVEEKNDIKNSFIKFCTFIKRNFGFNIQSKGIQSLKKKIDLSNDKTEIIKQFKIIVHELLCRKQINKYFEWLNLLKKSNNTMRCYMRKFFGCVTPKNDSILIENRKLIPLITNFFEIREKNYYTFKKEDSEEDILLIIKDLKKTLHKYRISVKLLHLLVDELQVAKILNSEYENERMLYKSLEEEKRKALENYKKETGKGIETAKGCKEAMGKRGGLMEGKRMVEGYAVSMENNEKDIINNGTHIERYEMKEKEKLKILEAKKVAIDENKNAILFYMCLIKDFKL
ncbi:hypothetical protein PMALA_019900 [Plasmodium malariae]|uniref:Uncharacterized protein n=1 Tax=Plasmodium malariae TaxID=5858 RepID=A0A1A8W799_PLAMA|nr:hypothetical protein PMALA_019900 [Plasmodium malariae]